MNNKTILRTSRLAGWALPMVLALCAITATAQTAKTKRLAHTDTASHVYQKYLQQLDNLKSRYTHWDYNGSDTLSNPYYFPLFSSPTFYTSSVSRVIGLSPAGSDRKLCATDSLLLATSDALNYVYTYAPWLIAHNETDLGTEPKVVQETKKDIRPEANLTEKAGADRPEFIETDEFGDWRIVARKPNFWSFKTTVSLQLSQNHTSDNWYKGGESNNSWLAQMIFEANYNNKQKVVLNNKLETKLGFRSIKDNQYHKFLSNADLLRLTNKLGLQATKHWYYTFQLQSWTQFYPGYKSGDNYVYSDFMSPFESIFSIGMDYKLSVKNFTLSATLSPLAYDFKYVDRKHLATSFGIDEGKHVKTSFGSNITINYTWNIIKNLSWTGRIYFYSDYKRVQLEWENTFKAQFNKYLSTQLFIYPRFDDGVARQPDKSYFQFQELLSFGLNVSF